MQDILIVVDMQNDFVDGVLGTPEAVAILPAVVEKLRGHRGPVIFTRDTHTEDYMNTREGKHLPVPHCIKGTAGWEISSALTPFAQNAKIVDKPTFGSTELVAYLLDIHRTCPIGRMTLVGVCTDICVISNAMLIKAALPEVDVVIDAACCAGVTPERHATALRAMEACQMVIENP